MTLDDIQKRLAAIVAGAELLTDRPVLIEEKGNLVSLLETALGTQSLAVVVTLASGQAKENPLPGRSIWTETFEVVIHRGLVDGDDVPATLTVLEDLRTRIHGATLAENNGGKGFFTCTRHDLREGGDGTYARVLNVTATLPEIIPMTITHKSGSSLDMLLKVAKDKLPLSLVGRTCTYLLKRSPDDPDASAVIRFESGGGLAVTNAATGEIHLTKTGPQMILTPGKYYGCLQLVGPAAGEVIEIPDQEISDLWVILKHSVHATS